MQAAKLEVNINEPLLLILHQPSRRGSHLIRIISYLLMVALATPNTSKAILTLVANQRLYKYIQIDKSISHKYIQHFLSRYIYILKFTHTQIHIIHKWFK